MITDFLSHKKHLNVLLLISGTTILYILNTKFGIYEMMLLVFLFAFFSLIIHIKAIAKGMMFIQEDPVMSEWVKLINKLYKKDDAE